MWTEDAIRRRLDDMDENGKKELAVALNRASSACSWSDSVTHLLTVLQAFDRPVVPDGDTEIVDLLTNRIVDSGRAANVAGRIASAIVKVERL